MRNLLIKINHVIHALLGAAVSVLVVYAFAASQHLDWLAPVLLLASIPLTVLGIGALISPARWHGALLVFHGLWLILSIAWGI